MKTIIAILIMIIYFLVLKLIKLNEDLAIYINNYYTAIKILGDYDPKLKEYLESKGK